MSNEAPAIHSPTKPKGGEPETHMRVTWKVVAVVLFVVSLGLLVALALVGGAASADALTTTAIALAVIAFGVQLIVYVAQVSDSADTRRQTSEVNAATQASLVRIGTTVEAQDHMLREQHSHVLKELISSVRRVGAESKEENSALTLGDVLELVESRLERGPDALRYESRALHPSRQHSQDDNNHDGGMAGHEPPTDPFEEWPNEEDALRVHPKLKSLAPISIAQLVRFGEDFRLSTQLEIEPGLLYSGPERSPFSCALIRTGLLQETGRHPRGRPPTQGFWPVFAVLTVEGLVAANLLMTAGVAPQYIRALATAPAEQG